MKVVNPAAAKCPRCGYDQRGVIESWKECCPLTGVCTECGLEWSWADLLSPRFRLPRWCVEHGRWWAFPWRAVKTLVVACVPWWFWTSLRMHHEFRWKRITAFLIGLMLMPYALFAVSNGAQAWWNWQSEYGPAGAFWYAKPTGFRLFKGSRILPTEAAPWAMAAWAALIPWSSESVGVMSVRTTFSNVVADPCEPPLGFTALPISRRICRVRKIHLFRIAAYGFPIALAPIAWIATLPWRLAPWQGFPSSIFMAWDALASLERGSILYAPILLVAWWAVAIKRHLRMPHGWQTALLLGLMSYLLLMLCGYFWFVYRRYPEIVVPQWWF